MINEIDFRLKNWAATIIGDQFDISFEHPRKIDNKSEVSIYLFALENAPTTSLAREIPMQMALSYLITVKADDQVMSHKLLGTLLLAAKSSSDFEIGFPAFSPEFWLAFGVVPMPYFIIKVPLIIPRQLIPEPTIKLQPTINVSPIARLTGLVLGPTKVPIHGATVIVGTSKSLTDKNGLFVIAVDTKNQHEFNCKVEVKGRQFSISLPLPEEPNMPVIIHLDALEV